MEIHERLSHQRWLTKSRNTYRHHKLITPFEFLSIFVLIHIPSNCNYIEASHGKFPLGVEAWYFCFSIASCYSKIYSLIRKRDKEKKNGIKYILLNYTTRKDHISYHNIPTNYFSGYFQDTKVKFNYGW